MTRSFESSLDRVCNTCQLIVRFPPLLSHVKREAVMFDVVHGMHLLLGFKFLTDQLDICQCMIIYWIPQKHTISSTIRF